MYELPSLLLAIGGGLLLGYLLGHFTRMKDDEIIMRTQSHTIQRLMMTIQGREEAITNLLDQLFEKGATITDLEAKLEERNRWIEEEVQPMLEAMLLHQRLQDLSNEKGGE